jgi:hypothetical protein
LANGPQRNLEKEGLYISRWWTGVIDNRSPLFTPMSAMGVQIIERQDTLWDGLNVMITPQYTLKRRYGNTKACSVALNFRLPLPVFNHCPVLSLQ